MLRLQNISKVYEGAAEEVIALESVDAEVAQGEFISIIGPSGCGKSTLLDIISGVQLPTGGTLSYQGEDIAGKVGVAAYMPQSDVLFPWRTIINNVILPLELSGIPKKEAMERAGELLEKFGLAGFKDSYPFMLSGGMRQRANFLRTYLTGKKLLLLDEPFGRLDAITRMELQEWLLHICSAEKLTVLLITHDVDEAIFMSDRIYALSKRPGKVVANRQVMADRPRDRQFFLTREFLHLKEELLMHLK
ncbi:ATP-binding cassette domain-containing protein [Bacillus lacus]|uniref:ATP-binding cassette domain-containing protein n=1 Tax=Metabacillus lacus TaxID=1983721 RepID=A0A7X2J2I0_9BACI|nr:ABC transporter ATP-binding protein [Metabacillus lacus]MRX74084.1 ATP-binding cassette domain-containing protein [Metabacillus lacus]